MGFVVVISLGCFSLQLLFLLMHGSLATFYLKLEGWIEVLSSCRFFLSETRITHVWLELTDSSGASSSSTYPLASGEFIIYDCRRFPNCQTCLNSRFDCVWHLMEGRCLSRASPLSFPPSSPQTSLDNSNFGLCAKSVSSCQSWCVIRCRSNHRRSCAHTHTSSLLSIHLVGFT